MALHVYRKAHSRRNPRAACLLTWFLVIADSRIPSCGLTWTALTSSTSNRTSNSNFNLESIKGAETDSVRIPSVIACGPSVVQRSRASRAVRSQAEPGNEGVRLHDLNR